MALKLHKFLEKLAPLKSGHRRAEIAKAQWHFFTHKKKSETTAWSIFSPLPPPPPPGRGSAWQRRHTML